MKIGILTFHRPINYGAFLQAFSLSNQLKNCFPESDVEIIDYIAPKERKTIYLNILRTAKYYGVDAALKELSKLRVFKKELNNLPLSQRFFCKEPLEEIFDYINNTYDLLVIGSDAIFNWNQNGYPTAFIPQYQFDIPVLTYAASVHGLRYLKEGMYPKLRECGQAFSKMIAVGVRDKNTERFVKLCNETVEPIHCCDPTVVLDLKALYALPHRTLTEIQQNYRINLSTPYIVLMIEDQAIATDIYNEYHKSYTIVSLFKKNKMADAFLYDLSAVEWALVISRASLVVTNFFHGTLLALKQNVPALVVDMSKYDEPYEGKLCDLMCRRLLLPELYIKQGDWQNSKKEMISLADDCLGGIFAKRIADGIDSEEKFFRTFITKLPNIKEQDNGNSETCE